MSQSLLELESLVSAGRPVADPGVRRALKRVASELKAYTNSSIEKKDHFVSALRCLQRIRGSGEVDLRVEALQNCMVFFFLNAQHPAAIEAAQAMKNAATASGSDANLVRAHLALGIIHAEDHRVGDAVMEYARAIEIGAMRNDSKNLICGWANLGIALNYGSLYRDAIPCIQRARQIAQEANEPELEANALCNLAQSHLGLGEHDKAEDAMTQCFAAQVTTDDRQGLYSRVVREYTFTRVAFIKRTSERLRDHALACATFATKLGSSRAYFLAAISRGLYEVGCGDVDEGLTRLEGAINSAEADIGSLRVDALDALVRAYDEAGRPEQAIACVRALIKMISTSWASVAAGQPVVSTETQARPDTSELSTLETRLELKLAKRDLEMVHVEMLERLAVAADLKEDISGEHGFRVGALSREIAQVLGWGYDDAFQLELAARLHDIGKNAMPDRILLSPNILEQAQRQYLTAHTTIGAELLASSNVPTLRFAEVVAKHHHEWWNGEGYPSRLKGNRIPIHARIVALADVFDALTHGRPFSPPWPVEKALAEIRARRGTQFDPELTDVFLNLMDRLLAEHEDLDAYLGRASRHSPFLQARNKIRRMLEEERTNERKAAVAGSEATH